MKSKYNHRFSLIGRRIEWEVFCHELDTDFAVIEQIPTYIGPLSICAWRKMGRSRARAAEAHRLKMLIQKIEWTDTSMTYFVAEAEEDAWTEYRQLIEEFRAQRDGLTLERRRSFSDRDWKAFQEYIGPLPRPWVVDWDAPNGSVAHRPLDGGICYLVLKRGSGETLMSALCFTEAESSLPDLAHQGFIGLYGQLDIRSEISDGLLQAMAHILLRKVTLLDRIYREQGL